MIGQHLQRAELLVQQGRMDQARQEVMKTLAADPHHSTAYTMLALILAKQGQHEEALDAAKRAIHFGPEEPASYYAMAYSLTRAEKTIDGLRVADRLLQLAPEWENAYAVKTQLLMQQEKFQEALDCVENGLSFAPESEWCLNLRSRLLTQLRRLDEAEENVDAVLRNNPESAYAHAGMGWALLHRGEAKRAASHFRESLRLEPDFEWARLGILEALKAKNIVYRYILRALLWFSTLTNQVQVIIIVAGFMGYRFSVKLLKYQPQLWPYLAPPIGLYLIFVYATWAHRPISNCMLLLHPFGRLALTKRERVGSMLVALLFAASIAAAAYAWRSELTIWWFATAAFLVGILPVAVTSELENKRARAIGAAFAAGQLIVGLSAVVAPKPFNVICGVLWVLSAFAWFWGAGFGLKFLDRQWS